MIDCTFARNPQGQWQCNQCGWIYPKQADKPPRRNCPKAKSRGLGDTIAKLTKAIGIKPCGGCKRRQRWLNGLLPYR